MEKGFFYSIVLSITLGLGISEAVAGNPFNWQPYEHEEGKDEGLNASSHTQGEEQEAQTEYQFDQQKNHDE